MSEWQPIATAPKDGGFAAPVDLLAQERERYAPQRITDCYFKDGRWLHLATIYDGDDTWDALDMVKVFNPTYWMPPPAPPDDTNTQRREQNGQPYPV